MSSPPVVLVAEDDPLLQRLLPRVLGGAGFHVLSAGDTESAIEVFTERGADIRVAVVDAGLAPRGCRPLLEAITKRRDDVGIVVVSGADPCEETIELISAYGGCYLRKPFSPEDLLRSVADARGGEAA